VDRPIVVAKKCLNHVSVIHTTVIILHLTGLLQTNEYVHIIALDFFKAFDTVKYSTLVSKLADFPLPDNVFHWLTDYLSEMKHQTKFNGITSSIQSIDASVIYGSALGPTAEFSNASDVHPINPTEHTEHLFKYADYLLNSCICQFSVYST